MSPEHLLSYLAYYQTSTIRLVSVCCETRKICLILKFYFQNDSRQPEILQHTNQLFHPQFGSEEILRASRRCYSILRAKSVQVRRNSYAPLFSVDRSGRLALRYVE